METAKKAGKPLHGHLPKFTLTYSHFSSLMTDDRREERREALPSIWSTLSLQRLRSVACYSAVLRGSFSCPLAYYLLNFRLN